MQGLNPWVYRSRITMSEQQTATSQPPASPAISPAWLKIEKARHPQRPLPMDLMGHIFTDFSEIHGDRAFADDEAVVCGMARLNGEEVMVIGNRKGGTTKERIRRNFGMPHPEGYRKALRAMKIAEKFNRAVVTFIDLPGAFPGLGAEERGQSEAIARNLFEMAKLKVPTIAIISGEGGSGGALALAVADRVLILENALYFVITPESCAAIMWRDASHKQLAAEAMRISAEEVKKLGCVDEIISEPAEGAHSNHEAASAMVRESIARHLKELWAMNTEQLVAARQAKFRNIAQFYREV